MGTPKEDHLRGAAFHEAGHAVVAWSFGLSVFEIHIRPQGEGNSETVTGSPEHLPLIDQLALRTAGNQAEQVFESPLPVWASGADRVEAINAVLKLFPGSPSDEVDLHLIAGRDRARERLDQHKSKVVRLAERLVEAHYVDASEFMRLMNAG